MNDCVKYERRKEMYKIDEFMERQGVRSSEACFILDEIERVLNEKDEKYLKLDIANNYTIDSAMMKIIKKDARIKELEEKVKELEEYKHRYESVSK